MCENSNNTIRVIITFTEEAALSTFVCSLLKRIYSKKKEKGANPFLKGPEIQIELHKICVLC